MDRKASKETLLRLFYLRILEIQSKFQLNIEILNHLNIKPQILKKIKLIQLFNYNPIIYLSVKENNHD